MSFYDQETKSQTVISSFKNFGLQVGFSELLLAINERGFTHSIRHIACKNYLKSKYKDVIEKYKNQRQPEVGIPDDAPIFILWFQGEEQMPPIVRLCYERAKRFCLNHPVILLNRENLKNYIDVPQIVYDKLDTGKFTIQFFADLIRNILIAKYGGIWMDATIYLSSPPPQFLNYKSPYFTMHGRLHANWNWTTSFFLMGAKNNILNSFIADLLLDYAIKEERQLDYFMFDYASEVGYDCVPAIKQLIDSIPETNRGRNYITARQQDPLDLNEFLELQKNTCIFKSSYKVPSDDPNSLYQYLLNNDRDK